MAEHWELNSASPGFDSQWLPAFHVLFLPHTIYINLLITALFIAVTMFTFTKHKQGCLYTCIIVIIIIAVNKLVVGVCAPKRCKD